MFTQIPKILKLSLFLVGLMIYAVEPALAGETASPRAARPASETTRDVLDNGLTVVVTEMPNSPAVSIYALFKTGAATEGPYLGTGISHFVEHMLFKGTEKRKVGDIAGEVQALGGVVNAQTGFDHTIYTLTLPADKFAQGLDIISDMILHSRFDSEELEKEREVILREIRLHNDHPDYYLSQVVFDHAYRVHPYRLPVIGYEDLFKKVSREDLLNYFHTHYAPNNMVLAIAGHVNRAEILPQVEKTFKDFPRQRDIPRNLPVEPPTFSEQRYEEEYPTELTHLSMAYKGVSIMNADMIPLDILSRILGQGESSRLYLELFSKQKLVYSISASDFTPDDPGIFEIEAKLDYKNIEQTLAAVRSTVAEVQKNGIEQAELDKIKRQVLSEFFRGRQTSEDVAGDTAVNEASLGDCRFAKTYVDLVDAVTTEDIRRVANQYLVGRHLSVVLLKPKQAEKNQQVKAPLAAVGDIKKIVLTNGLTVLLRENHRLPIVTIQMSLNGGTRVEPATLNGLSELTARVWTKGTTTRSAEKIAQDVESRGMGFSAFSGRNSLGLSIQALAGDFDFALSLLEETLKDPAFAEKELQKEKEKMYAQILSRDNEIGQKTGQTMKQLLFKDHPFGWEQLGSRETVARIRRGDVLDFYHRYFSAPNMVFTVFGDFDATRLAAELEKKFAFLPRQKVELPAHDVKPPAGLVEKTISMDKEQAMVAIGFLGETFSHPDQYGLQVLSGILGSSFSGRMFSVIRDQLGLAYTLGGRFVPGPDTGMIYFQVLTKEENIPAVKEALLKLLQEIRTVGVTDKELQDMKTYLKGSYQRGTETDGELAFLSSLDELYGLGFAQYKNYGVQIDRVTVADIQRLAQKYLNPDQAVLVICRPTAAVPGGNPVKK